MAEDFEAFGLAVKRKLIREIAGMPAGDATRRSWGTRTGPAVAPRGPVTGRG